MRCVDWQAVDLTQHSLSLRKTDNMHKALIKDAMQCTLPKPPRVGKIIAQYLQTAIILHSVEVQVKTRTGN